MEGHEEPLEADEVMKRTVQCSAVQYTSLEYS